jgi:hypothetical protein
MIGLQFHEESATYLDAGPDNRQPVDHPDELGIALEFVRIFGAVELTIYLGMERL